MDREQLLLGKLAEECNEVAQRALKAQQFGRDEIQPGQEFNNRYRLEREFNDLLAIVEMLNDDFGYDLTPDIWAIKAKITKVNKYAKLSIKLGKVRP